MSEIIIRRKTYILTCIALLVLTVTTWQVALVDLGRWNLVVALAIAFGKACLVALFFMHQRYTHGRTRLALVAGVFWLALLILLTLNDYLTR